MKLPEMKGEVGGCYDFLKSKHWQLDSLIFDIADVKFYSPNTPSNGQYLIVETGVRYFKLKFGNIKEKKKKKICFFDF